MLDHLRTSTLRALSFPMLLTFALFLSACSQQKMERFIGSLFEMLLIALVVIAILTIISIVILVLEIVVIVFNLTRPNRFTAIAGFVCGGFHTVTALGGVFNMLNKLADSSEHVTANQSDAVSAVLGLAMLLGFGGLLIWSGWRGWNTIQAQKLALFEDNDEVHEDGAS